MNSPIRKGVTSTDAERRIICPIIRQRLNKCFELNENSSSTFAHETIPCVYYTIAIRKVKQIC